MAQGFIFLCNNDTESECVARRSSPRWDRDYRFSPGARLQTVSARTREWLPLAFAIRRERGAASPNIVMARDASPARVRVRC